MSWYSQIVRKMGKLCNKRWSTFWIKYFLSFFRIWRVFLENKIRISYLNTWYVEQLSSHLVRLALVLRFWGRFRETQLVGVTWYVEKAKAEKKLPKSISEICNSRLMPLAAWTQACLMPRQCTRNKRQPRPNPSYPESNFESFELVPRLSAKSAAESYLAEAGDLQHAPPSPGCGREGGNLVVNLPAATSPRRFRFENAAPFRSSKVYQKVQRVLPRNSLDSRAS